MDTTTVRFGDLKLKLCCILRRMCSIFNLNQDTIRLQIGATTKSLTELETMFGEIPWNDVRISAKKTQHLERVSRAIVRGSDDDKQICRAVAVPGFMIIPLQLQTTNVRVKLKTCWVLYWE